MSELPNQFGISTIHSLKGGVDFGPNDRDSLIASVPDKFLKKNDAESFGLWLAKLTHGAAGSLHRTLYDAEYDLTTDPEVVKRHGQAHNCGGCRAATDQALAQLREHPEGVLLVGTLRYVPED